MHFAAVRFGRPLRHCHLLAFGQCLTRFLCFALCLLIATGMQPWVHERRQLGIKPIQYARAVAHLPAERVGADAAL